MSGVTLLPKELHGAQERPRGLLPAHDVRPLVDQNRQVPIGFDPLRVHRSDHRLRGRSNRQTLRQLFAAALRHPGDLRRKSLDVLGLPYQQTFGNEQWKVRILVARGLESRIELSLQVLPEPEPVRTKNDAAANG